MAYLAAAGDGIHGGSGENGTWGKERVASGGASATVLSDGLPGDILTGALLEERTELAQRVRIAVQTEIEAYRAIAAEALDDEVDSQLGQLLRSAGGARALTDGEVVILDALGERRALAGVAEHDVLRAWRIAVEVVIGYARELAERRGIAEVRVLELVQSVLSWSDLAMVGITRAHRRAATAATGGSEGSRSDFVRGVLLGTISLAELRIQAEMYGLDPAATYVAVRARVGEETDQHRLERALGLRDSVRDRSGLVAIVDGDAAGFLSEAPPNGFQGVVGYGPPRPLERLVESYRSAARALVTAEACGLKGAHDVASLGLRPAIALDVEMGELVRQRYLEPLAAANSEADLIATLRTYLACGMHVERTATRLFVHQNTVRYRIARFEELTGKDLSDIEVLFEVWWALEVSAMHL